MQDHSNPNPVGSRNWKPFVFPLLAGVGVFAALAIAATQGIVQFLVSLLLFGVAGAFVVKSYRFSSESNDRKLLAAEAEEAQVNYQSIFNNAVEGIFQSTPEGSFITANPALVQMFGRESAEELFTEMVGWPGRHFFVDPVRWAEMLRLIEQQQSVGDFEAEVIRKDGRTIWISQNVHAVRDENGKLEYLEGAVVDITARHWAEKRRQIQYSTARILSNSDSVVEARPKILQAICEVLEWDMGAVWDVVLPENLLRCVEIWHAQGIDISEFENVSTEVPFTPGVRLAGRVWQTGEPAWVVDLTDETFSPNALVAAKHGMNSAFAIPVKVGGEVMHVLEFFSPKASEPDPELLQLLGVVANQIGYLIERKLAEQALHDTVARKAAILEGALDCIITFDNEGKVIEWNPTAERTFGYRAQDVLGRSLVELIIPEPLRGEPGGGLPLYTAAGMSLRRRSEITVMRSNGQEFPAEAAIAKVQLQNRPLFTAYLRDITEVKRAERSQSELAAVVAASEDAIVSTTPDGIIVSWNPGAERIYGYTAQEIINRPASTLVPADGLEEFAKGLASVRQGRSIQNLEVVRLRKDGARICVSLTEAPIRNERGMITGVASTARDVTENKRIESRLLQSQKMEAVGRLAGGVAHDFNNIITAILGYTDLMLNQVEPKSLLYRQLSEIQKAGQFATSLTHQLLAFSRGQALAVKVLDMNAVIASIQPILRRLIGEHIQIVTVPSNGASRVRGDSGQLEQVLLNLALNARDAMPSGGVLTIQTSNVEITPGGPNQHEVVPPGEWVQLIVRDTGSGMNEQVKEHVFEPFFSTKEHGVGTGLGLATCQGIVKSSGGYILCESTPGLGTSFQIFLPQVESPLVDTAPAESELEGLDLPGGTETILLVEDEASVRRLTASVLQMLGYQVLEAGGCEEAQSIVKKNPERRIDLLLSDVVLPSSGGKELADWVSENSPGTRVLFTSGYVEEVVFNNYGVNPEMPFLQKPFSPAALAIKVREVIGQK
ncbi:MAG: PAS domain S-box protein [Verrucomicrobiota bacterium]